MKSTHETVSMLPGAERAPGPPGTSWRRRLARGVSALEFALVSPLVIFVLFFSLEMGFDMWVDSTLESAASKVSRLGQLGIPEGTDCDTEVRRIFADNMFGWVASPDDLQVDVRIYTPGAGNTPPNIDDPDYKPVCDAGGRGDIVIYRLGFDKPSFTGMLGALGLNVMRYQRAVIIQNEP